MKKKIALIGILVLIVIVSGCIQQTPETIKEANICGDGICGATEDCNTCVEDCSCKPGEYCNDIGICRTEICGDEVCSSEEDRNQSCCDDCGCPSDKICNKLLHICQEVPIISEREVKNIANDYISQNNITGTITDIIDSYYKEEIVKQVNIDCKTEEVPYPCEVILYINNKGEIIEEIRTT